MVSLAVFIMATLEIVLGQKKLLDGRNGPFGDNVFKIRLDYFLFYSFVTSSLPCRKDQFAVYIFYKLLLYWSRSTTRRSGATQWFVTVDLLVFIARLSGLGSKLYPSNIQRMLNKHLTRLNTDSFSSPPKSCKGKKGSASRVIAWTVGRS